MLKRKKWKNKYYKEKNKIRELNNTIQELMKDKFDLILLKDNKIVCGITKEGVTFKPLN